VIPAVVIDETGRIVASSRAAQALLPPAILGRSCHEVLEGDDVFGNLFCRERCAVSEMAWRRETPRYFEMTIHCRDRTRRVGCVTTVQRSPGATGFRLLHVFRPLDASAHRGSATPAPRPPPLTRREREVLGMVARLEEPGRIAADLGIAVSTARRHLRALQRKLGSRGMLETIYRAGERNLL